MEIIRRTAAGILAIMLAVMLMPFAAKGTQAEEAGKTCLITITNGAAEANSDEGTNSVHVYDPNTEEKDDFFSGSEVAAGTTVKIFVYNLASPVHLTITHGGELLADRIYDTKIAWVDDDKIEFFEFELEGDLEVVTEVADPEAAEESEASEPEEGMEPEDLMDDGAAESSDGIVPLSGLVVSASGCCSVTVAGTEVPDGAISAAQTRGDVTVTRLDEDVFVKLTAPGRCGFVRLTESFPSYTFSDVDLMAEEILLTAFPVSAK